MVHKSQWNAWLLAATLPAILSTIGRNGWPTVLLVAVVTGVLCLCAISCPGLPLPRWLCILELVWLVVFLAAITQHADACWAQAEYSSLVLLALAAFAARNGALRAARLGATLMWLALPLVALVFLAGTADGNVNWMRTEFEMPDGIIVGLLMLPALSVFLPTQTGRSAKWIVLALGIVATLSAAVMDAVLGQAVAIGAESTFYEFSKSVNLFGVAERFEAVIACVLTMGWFLLFSVILSVAFHLLEQLGVKNKKIWIWVFAALAGAGMWIVPNGGNFVAVGSLIFWGFLPAVTQGVVGAKNIVKK